jgi:hypothetical protein
MKKPLIIILSLFSMSTFATCDLQEYKSGSNKVHLVELYTSEGCSSCPPADKWMNSLLNHNRLYKSFIPIKLHVDYWNYLGWKDRFSQPKFTQRQRDYAAEWGNSNIYTPGFAINGDEWRFKFMNKLTKKIKAKGELNIKKKSKNTFNAEFLSKKIDKNKYFIYTAILGHNLKNKITRGENKGKSLSHNFVVLSLNNQQLQNGKTTIRLPSIDNEVSEKSIVFWVTKRGSLKAIQSTGGCL